MKPLPGKDVPITTPQPLLVEQGYYEFFQSLNALLLSTASALSALPAHDVTKSDVTRTINAQSGTTYTFLLTDAGNMVEFTNGSPVAVTIPLNSSVAFPIGTQIDVMAGGAGKVTFAGAGGVTLKSVSSLKSLSAQEAAGTLVKMATDTWRLMGSLVA